MALQNLRTERNREIDVQHSETPGNVTRVISRPLETTSASFKTKGLSALLTTSPASCLSRIRIANMQAVERAAGDGEAGACGMDNISEPGCHLENERRTACLRRSTAVGARLHCYFELRYGHR